MLGLQHVAPLLPHSLGVRTEVEERRRQYNFLGDDPLAWAARTTWLASNRLTWLSCYSCLRPSSTWQTPTQGHTPAHAHMLGTPATDTNTNAATDDRPQSTGLDAHTLVEQEHSR
jgi:hypothetical protein